MNRLQVQSKLKEMLQERFAIAPERLDGSTRQSDLGIDSILMVDLMLDLETELGVTLGSMDLPPDPSLDEITDMVLSNAGSD